MIIEPKAVAEKLNRILAEGIASSSDLQKSLRGLRERGYRFHLVIRSSKEPDGDLGVEVGSTTSRKTDAVFRLDSDDVVFLESLGIDATRSVRRRKSP